MQSRRGSKVLFDQSWQPGVIQTLSELQEQKETNAVLNSNVADEVAVPLKSKKNQIKKNQKSGDEESDAVTKVFKTMDAYFEFQQKYKEPISDFESTKVRHILLNSSWKIR